MRQGFHPLAFLGNVEKYENMSREHFALVRFLTRISSSMTSSKRFWCMKRYSYKTIRLEGISQEESKIIKINY